MPKASQYYNLQQNNPNLAFEWHPGKNGTLTPMEVAPNSHKKVWWMCNKGHEWDAQIRSRNKGRGCPFCKSEFIQYRKSLLKVKQDLSKEWHPTKNGTLILKDVSKGSRKKAWWICKNGHEWKAIVANRNYGKGCPYCKGRKVCEDNCLQTISPDLSKEWHPTKNGNLTPKNVTIKSAKTVWWICSKDHEWKAIIANRSNGTNCPYCSGHRVCEDNSLESLNQALSKEWHPTKNKKLTPGDVTPGSNKKVWWLCEKGHEWAAQINSRNRGGHGCRYCWMLSGPDRWTKKWR